MPLTLVIRIALRALRRNTLRSVLSMLGISIGVGAFLCSVAVGQGASHHIEEQIRSLGENFIWIEAGNRNVKSAYRFADCRSDAGRATRVKEPV